MKRLGVLPLSPGWDANLSEGYRPSISSGFPNNSPVPIYTYGRRGTAPIYTPGWRETLKVNYFTQEHNRMTQLGLEPRPPRPGIHCTNHYATATKAPLPPPPYPLPPTPSPLVPSLLMFKLFRLLFLYIRFIVSLRTKTFLRDKLIF